MNKETMKQSIERTLLSEEEIQSAVRHLGQQITRDYAGKQPVMICILKGASLFFTDLIRNIDLPISLDFMAISSYGSSTKSSGVVRILKDLDHDVLGKDVIIVEDIIDSGLTLSYLKQTLYQRGVSSLRMVTLLDKPERRKTELKADYACFQIPNEFVVGYGLDYNEYFRNLPYIGILKPSVYSNSNE